MSHPQPPSGPFPQPPAGGASLWGSQAAAQQQPPVQAPPPAEPSWGLDAVLPPMPTTVRPYQPPKSPEPSAGLGAGFWPGVAAGSGATALATGFVFLMVWGAGPSAKGTADDPLPAPTNMLAALRAIKERTDKGLPPPVFAPPAGAKPKKSEAETNVAWAAAGESATLGKVAVDLAERWRGEPALNDFLTGKPPTIGDHLILRMKVTNANPTRKIDFKTWGGWIGAFNDRDAELIDEHGNRYKLVSPPSGTRWIDHALTASIGPEAAHVDLLIFEAPIAAAKELRLTLPGKNIGEEGELQLRFPVASVLPMPSQTKNP